MTPETTIDSVVLDRSIIICCGSGGVGKTTIAAAFALQAARLGRTACVVTIDPARRLANSLGLDTLTNRPTRIEGPWPGELHALMLDPKGTFDDLVLRYSDSSEQAEDIKVNRIYRNLTGSLSGTQEYMAMEKLYELVEEGGFDVVVVDTPPSRNALDFLDAPRRLTRFLENRVFQALMMPTRVGLRIMGVAAQALLRTISKVAGAEIVADAVAFFRQVGRVGDVGERSGGQPGATTVRRRFPAGHPDRPGHAPGGLQAGRPGREPPRLYGGLRPRRARLHRSRVPGGSGPGLPGAASEH
jgi:anion-transporting  ArsA/GET3 family ATPase